MQVDQASTRVFGIDVVGKISVLCAGTNHASQCPPPLTALKHLIDELAERLAQHLRARQGFLAAGNLVAASQGLGSFAAILGVCVSSHPLRGLGVAIAVLGAIITTLSGK